MAPTLKKGLLKKPLQRKNQLLANFLIVLGILLIFSGLVIPNYYIPLSKVSGNEIILSKKGSTDSLKPISITLENLTNEIPIKPGHFNGEREWDLSKNEALYLDSSGIPGKEGNMVIYGHNNKQVFSPLFDEKVGNIIKIKTNTNQIIEYRIDGIKSVFPTNVEILSQETEEEKLTLFTCNGLFDSMRLVITAKRV